MFLKSISLQNFRCFRKKIFAFSSKTNLIVGPNAAGKTNILEAIFCLATGKSFRASREEEMIYYGEELARVTSKVDEKIGNEFSDLLRSPGQKFFSSNRTRNNSTSPLAFERDAASVKKENFSQASRKSFDCLEVILTLGEVQGKKTAKKIYKVNGVGKRWRDFAGQLKVVLFRPEDIDLILGPPSLRRNFLNSVLEQVDWQYRVCHLAYKKGLRQRNKLLDRIREGKAQSSQLTFWDQLLLKNGEIITQKRSQMIDFFNDKLRQENLEIFYDISPISPERLAKYHEAELALGVTLVGPHRDDFQLKIGEARDLRLYGSRGEQRMAVLQLKMAELSFMTQKSGTQPILLLDDIFSELDYTHRKLVGEIINTTQVIITSTEKEKALGKKQLTKIALSN